VRQIVSTAEVTAPVLYYHFGSKEGVLLAVVQRVHGWLHEIADRAVCRCGTVRQSLCDFADGLSGFARERAEMGRLCGLIQLGAFPTAPPALTAPYAERLRERVRSMVREGVERGEFRPGTTEAMTWAILGAVAVGLQRGVSSSWAMEQEGLKDVLEVILRGNEAEDRCDPSAGEVLCGSPDPGLNRLREWDRARGTTTRVQGGA
jgi:AcrR family transcriptional regulator